MGATEISVLLPAYEAGARLRAAAASILGQDGPALELVIVDDGSTDDTGLHLKSLAEADPRVRPISIEHRGLVGALNAGLDACRGAIVVRQDHDDRSLPGRLAALHALFADPAVVAADTGIVLLATEATGPGMRRWARWIEGLGTSHEALSLERYVDCPLTAMALRRSAVEAAGGYRERGWNEDHDLLLRLLQRGGRLARDPRPLYALWDRPDRVSRTADHTAIDRLRALKAHFLARHELRPEALGGRGIWLWGAGRHGKRMARALQAEGVELAGFVELHPRKIGRTIAGIPVIAPADLPSPEEAFVLAAVGKPGGREDIRRRLMEGSFVEERDFLVVG